MRQGASVVTTVECKFFLKQRVRNFAIPSVVTIVKFKLYLT